MGPTERLERAIDRLTTYGWCQGSYGNECIGYCALGALVPHETFTPDQVPPGARAALAAVAEVVGVPPSEIAMWNDEPGRRAHEVIGALVLAAELSRKREFVEEPEPSGELVPA